MIVTADWHLQIQPPRCRKETESQWIRHQEDRINWIVGKANEYHQDLYIAGDITDKAVSSHVLTRMFIQAMNGLEGICYIMPGNHCLPNHSFDEMDKANYGILEAISHGGGNIKTIDQSPYAYVPYGKDGWKGNFEPRILFIHRLVFPSPNDIPPGSDGISARALLNEYPDPSVIVTGDNHTKFLYERGDRALVNCGCITKRAIDFQDKDLAIWMINEGNLEMQEIQIPDSSELVRDNHVEVQEENEEKFKALVEMLKETGTMTLDFLGNLEQNKDSLSKEGQSILGEVI